MRSEATILLDDSEDATGYSSEIDANGDQKVTDRWVVIGGRARRLLALRLTNEDSSPPPELPRQFLEPPAGPDI